MRATRRCVCKYCGGNFKWFRRRNVCDTCRIINETQRKIKYQTKLRNRPLITSLGTNQFTSTEIVVGKDGKTHVKGYQDLLEEIKKI